MIAKFYDSWSKRIGFLAAILALIWLWSPMVHYYHPKPPAFPEHITNTTTTPAPIPNIVHYVWKMKEADGPFILGFEDFLSIYSASIYFQPDKIYIHTDALAARIEEAHPANEDLINRWTLRTLKIKNLVVRKMKFPSHTTSGKEISALEHLSDFIRPKLL